MRKSLWFITAFLLAAGASAEELPAQAGGAAAPEAAETAGVLVSTGNPESTLPVGQQKKPESPVSDLKVNYFSLNHWPSDSSAQVKFQISMKFRVLEPNLYVLKHNIFPASVGYTQKSLWNEGRSSKPFEESNYNPEFFLDYRVNLLSVGRIKLRNIIVSPLEHESNGLSGGQSRSWNRQYVMLKFGLQALKELEISNSFVPDKAVLRLKFWSATGYASQNDYLRSVGSSRKFLDYMGVGEAGLSVRNFLWRGSLKNHQLDITTPLFRYRRRPSYAFEFRQQLPHMNFALYLQYWYGYGETLLRFDQFGRRGFAGLSFSY